MEKNLGWLLLAISTGAVLATRLHHLIVNYHLTEAQALINYWPLWLGAAGCVLVGYHLLVKDENEKENTTE